MTAEQMLDLAKSFIKVHKLGYKKGLKDMFNKIQTCNCTKMECEWVNDTCITDFEDCPIIKNLLKEVK